MLPRLTRPSSAAAARELAALRHLPVTYWERGGTSWSRMPQGYDHAIDRVTLGWTHNVWLAATEAIQHWHMYPSEPWVDLHERLPLEVGVQVMVLFRMFGLWWSSPCRVVYLINEPNRVGFAYGTLPGHVESGEESFMVERNPLTGEVSYEIKMMARGRHLLAKLFPFVMHWMQRRFRKTSMRAMEAYVQQRLVATHAPLNDDSIQLVTLAN